jgi:hypothetical protein
MRGEYGPDLTGCQIRLGAACGPVPQTYEGGRENGAENRPIGYVLNMFRSASLARPAVFRRLALVGLALLPVAVLLAASGSPVHAASKSKGELWFMTFDVTYELADDATWTFDRQDECNRSVGRGQQKVRATIDAGTGDLEVRRTGRRWSPDTSSDAGVLSNVGGDESTGKANYDLSSDKDDQSLPGPGCPEPIICPECNSEPPRKICGQATGSVTLMPRVEFSGRKARLRLEDQWEPSDPFSDPDRNAYCPESGAVWTWGSGFPATSNPEGDQVIEIDTNRLMGFTSRLSDRQRASCGTFVRRPTGGRKLAYKRSACGSGKKEPSFIRKADYSRSTKTILLRDDPAPQQWKVDQTSTIKVSFKFKELKTYRSD